MAATYAQRKALGDFGERLSAEFLQAHGMLILDRNWRCSAGELDIVAADGGVIVGCEVKTRSSDRFGTPLEAVTADKAARLHRLVQRWAADHRARYAGLRVDVIAVRVRRHHPVTIRHIVGVG
jgi:putative endonuclease